MNFKKIILLCLSLFSKYCYTQVNIRPSDTLYINGKIKQPAKFSLAVLDTFAKHDIKSQVIYNHAGEKKDSLFAMRGIPIKNILASVDYLYQKPKELNEFYFIFSATDGYKVVFSWNEIYNTDTGNHFFIITELKGKKLKEMSQRILFLSEADLKSGRRYIKSLQNIEVKKID